MAKKCSKCGYYTSDDMIECPKCGSSVIEDIEYKTIHFVETPDKSKEYTTIPYHVTKKKADMNIPLLVSMAIGLVYIIGSVSYFKDAFQDNTTLEQLAAGLATVMALPHYICTLIAVIFNALGAFLRSSAFALVSAILYTIALALFPIYFKFVIIEMVLSYIAYAQMKK